MSASTRIRILPLAAACLWGVQVRADPPEARYLFPAGGQRGTMVKFHAGGLNLNPSCNLEMVGPGVTASPVVKRTESVWFEGPILPLPESQRQEDYPRAMAGTVAIKADAPLGDRYVLLRTAQGVTTPMRFVVGELPEVVEDELPGEPVPVAVAAPLTINGRIFPREDVDVWTVELKKGQTLAAVVDADRIGSPLEARLEVRDPAGKVIGEAAAAAGKDPRVRAPAAADGTYQVRITDARSEGGPAFVYRLTLTTGPVVDRVFPLGGRRGSRVDLDVTGAGVPATAAVSIPADAGTSFAARVGTSLPFALDVDDLAEVRESDTPDPVRGNYLPVPAVGNGRIAAAGETDRWGFSARKGDVLEIELRAARLGSPLLGVLAVTDAAGKELATAEPGAAPATDPVLRFTPPADGLYFATVRDRFHTRGGPAFAYRLRVDRPGPGFDLSFTTLGVSVLRGQQVPLKVTARRHGSFAGPIAVSLDGLPAGITGPKEIVIPAGQPAVDVPLKADATAKVDQALVRVRGTGMVSLAPYTAMFAPVAQTARWADDPSVDQVRLAVGVPTPFKIAGEYEMRLIPRGTVYARKYKIERNGFTGPVEISMADKQARHLQGAAGPTFVVPGDKSEFDYPVTLPPWMEAGRTCRVCVMGTATVKDPDGTAHVVTYSSREQNDQVIAVVEPERLTLRLDRPTVLAAPGGTVEVKLEVRRGDGLKGPATVDVLIPRGVRGVSAQPVKVADADQAGVLKLHFTPDARGPFPMPLTVRATVMDGANPVTAERTLELVVPR